MMVCGIFSLFQLMSTFHRDPLKNDVQLSQCSSAVLIENLDTVFLEINYFYQYLANLLLCKHLQEKRKNDRVGNVFMASIKDMK